MQTEDNMRTDLWTLAVALYKTSLASHEEVEKWDRHAMAFDSHELEGNLFTIGVADSYSAEYYSSLYADPLRVALVKAGAPAEVKVQFKVTESAEKAAQQKQILEQQRKVLGDTQAILKKFDSTVPLNANYTFENFVIHLPMRLLRQSQRNPAEAQTIHSSSGAGPDSARRTLCRLSDTM